MVERVWPHVNSRVNYPLKRLLIRMTEDEVLDMSCPITQFCVSNITLKTSTIGLQRFIDSWNSHTISGGECLQYQVYSAYLSLVPKIFVIRIVTYELTVQ